VNRLATFTRTFFTRTVQIALVLAIVVGTAGFLFLQKSVTVSVDGTERTVNTFAGSVGALLDRQGIEVSERDLVQPALDAPVDDGDSVTVRFARLLTLVLDGKEREVWVIADSVDEALDQLGLRSENAFLSSSRSSAIGRDGLELEMRTQKNVSVAVDGAVKELATTAITVREVLEEAAVTVNAADIVEPSLGTLIADGAALAVKRVTNAEVTETIPIPFASETREDSDEYEDYEEIVQSGVTGARTKVYRVTKIDGVESYRVTTSDGVTTQPVTQVTAVGTKVRPAPAPEPQPEPDTPDAPNAPTYPGGSVWDDLAQCESGGNWSINTGNGYYGGLQFSYGTWLAYGGGVYAETANNASREQQIVIGQKVQAGQGWGAWPSCARQLGLL